jgi:hypothetical protein
MSHGKHGKGEVLSIAQSEDFKGDNGDLVRAKAVMASSWSSYV